MHSLASKLDGMNNGELNQLIDKKLQLQTLILSE
uniref:Uncharacterized protein n=1 Tax=Rhizophora mucronata TaxID=61149 RepID=A0A2P2P4U4_RHIMU